MSEVMPNQKRNEENLKYKHVYYKRKDSNRNEDEANLKFKHAMRKNPTPRHRAATAVTNRTESPTVPEVSYDHSLYPIFLDPTYWKRTLVCCGVVFVGQLGEKALDQRFFKPCSRQKWCLSPAGARREAEESSNMDSETRSVIHDYDTDTGEFYDVSGKSSPVEDDSLSSDSVEYEDMWTCPMDMDGDKIDTHEL